MLVAMVAMVVVKGGVVGVVVAVLAVGVWAASVLVTAMRSSST